MATAAQGNTAEATRVTEQQLAVVLDCDPQTIRKYARDGLAHKSGRGTYLLFPSIKGVVNHFRMLASHHGTRKHDAMRANAELRDAQRRLTDLRYQREAGELISLQDIEHAWGDLAQGAQYIVRSIPGRARAAMPHLTRQDQTTLQNVCLELLREVALSGKPQMPTAVIEEEQA